MICPICNDSGWKYIGPDSDRRVAPCDCRQQQRAERLLKLARIPRRYEHCEFSGFETSFPQTGENKSLVRARIAAQKFVEQYPCDSHGLLLFGDIGVGKTHLAVAVLRELIKTRNVAGLFYEYRDLLKTIQDSYNPSVQTTELEILRPVMNAEVLVLDELGAVKPSEWAWDTVSLILNTRYNENRTTIITTNLADLPPRDAAGTEDARSAAAARRASSEPTLGDRITERMRSRLSEMCRKVEMKGEDFRQKFKKAAFHSV